MFIVKCYVVFFFFYIYSNISIACPGKLKTPFIISNGNSIFPMYHYTDIQEFFRVMVCLTILR